LSGFISYTVQIVECGLERNLLR